MKLRFNRQAMVDALSVVGSVTPVRSTKEILKCVRLQANADVLVLSATDMELGVRMAVTQVEVDDTGDTLVSAATLGKIVRECTDEILAIESAGNTLHIRGAGSHFQIIMQDTVDFPHVPTLEGDPNFSVEHGNLRRQIEWTSFAAARESTRYAINGVLWEVDGNRLTLAATDGRRLSVAHDTLTDAREGEPLQAIVPSKSLGLFARLPVEHDALVGVKLSANQMILKAGGATLSTVLVEGHFPPYSDVVPKDCDRVVELDTQEFLSALKRAALLTNEESKGVRLTFGEDELTLSSRAPEQGEATISLGVSYRGEPTDIGFNPVFLTDVLRVTHTDRVTFAFKEANKPGIIRIGDDFVHVVMPVNLSSG